MPDRLLFGDDPHAALRATFDHMLEGIQLIDSDFRYCYLNEAAARQGQRRREELLGRRMTEMYPGIEQSAMFACLEQCLADGAPHRLLNQFTFPDGTHGWFELRLARVPAGVVIMSVDVSEQRNAEDALRDSLAALMKAERQRTEFLTMLAHELRNPLASLQTGLHVILNKPISTDPDVRLATDAMDRQLRHLGRLVDDLLDATRVTRGRVTLVRERTDLALVVREAAADQASRFADRGLPLHLDVPETPVWVDGDAVRLAQVCGNLLDNALKFSTGSDVGAVSVRMSAAAGTVTLMVIDAGIGIGSEALPYIFDPLYQADSSLDRTRGGVGVGLTLAKALIEAHDGSVVVESGGLGHGTTVKIALPRLAEPAAVVSLPVETPGASMVSTTERARAMDQSPPSNPQVLVIEDNLDAARTLGTVLTLWGYRVQLAHTGPDGVKAAQASRPQIVLCDIGLPGMDGYEVARTLRATPDTRNARLIAITGYGREEDSRRAREAGFDVHLVKPVEPTTLRRRLAS